MGRSARPRPVRLAAKLLRLRLLLGLSQTAMIERLDYRLSPLTLAGLWEFEHGRREPPLPLLLRYARLARLPLEVLVDDELNLPDLLPNPGQTRARIAGQAGGCPSCGGGPEAQAPAGRTPKGSLRYRCRLCGRRHTPGPFPHRHPEEVRQRAVRLHEGGLSFRQAARAAGVSYQSVVNWVLAHRARASPSHLPLGDGRRLTTRHDG